MNMRCSNWAREMRLNNRWATHFSYGLDRMKSVKTAVCIERLFAPNVDSSCSTFIWKLCKKWKKQWLVWKRFIRMRWITRWFFKALVDFRTNCGFASWTRGTPWPYDYWVAHFPAAICLSPLSPRSGGVIQCKAVPFMLLPYFAL